MKKTSKYLLLLITVLSLILTSFSVSFAISNENPAGTVIIQGVSKISISATRPASTSAKITATGPLTSMASSITTKATLYIYNSSTGSLTAANVSPVTKTANNCTTYSFATTFTVEPAKVYKVKLEVTDVTNGVTNKIVAYSNAF